MSTSNGREGRVLRCRMEPGWRGVYMQTVGREGMNWCFCGELSRSVAAFPHE